MRSPIRPFSAFRVLSLVFGALGLTALAGCYTIRTPDGHTLTSLSTPADVRTKLGEPDLVEERDFRGTLKVDGDMRNHHWSSMTYLDRWYRVQFRDGRAVFVYQIPVVERSGVTEKARAYKASMESK